MKDLLDVVGKVVDLIKLPPRYIIPIVIVAGILSFAPDAILDGLGIRGFVQQYRPYIVVIFLLSTAFVVTPLLVELAKLAADNILGDLILSRARKSLNSLSEDEKALLRGFLRTPTRTLDLPLGDGVVQSLEAKRVIYPSTGFALIGPFQHPRGERAYSVSPWAWVFLRNHPDLLQ